MIDSDGERQVSQT